MKIGRVWMFLVAVTGVTLGGCETGPPPHVNDAAPPSGDVAVKSPSPPSDATTSGSSPKESMDRLIREMEGTPSLPEESKVPVQHPEDRLQPPAPASGFGGRCPPAWAKTYEQSSDDVRSGVGESTESQKSAEAAARLEIAKTLEVDISGQETIQARETADQGFAYSVESTIVERVTLKLAGFSTTNVEKCGKTWYARAELNLANAATAWRADLDGLDRKAKILSQGAHAPDNDVFAQLVAQYRLAVVLETASQIQQRLRLLPGQPEPKSGVLKGPAQAAKQQYEKLLRSFQVELSGNNQQAVEGQALPEPFVVKVVAGKNPVARVPVAFTVKKGKITVSSEMKETDENGEANVTGSYPVPLENEDPAQIDVQVRLDRMVDTRSNDELRPLKLAVERRQGTLKDKFLVKPPVFHRVKKARQLVSKANTWREEREERRTRKNVFGVMGAMAELYKVQKAGEPVIGRLRELHPPSGKLAKALGAPEETLGDLERLVRSFQFKLVGGDGQQADLKHPLSNALQARLVATLGENEVPVPDVPVRFTFDDKSGEVDPDRRTDKEGYVRANVHRVEPGSGKDGPAFVTASLDMSDCRPVPSLPSSVCEQFLRRLQEETPRFRIMRPLGCKSGDPFQQPLFQLACDLVGQADRSVGKSTVVRDFVMSGSDKPSPLSHRIGKALRAGLVLTRQLDILSPSAAGNAVTSSKPEVEVSGSYGLSQGSLNVQAELTRLNDPDGKGPVTKGWSQTNVPLETLSKTELSAFPSPAPVSVVPNPSDFDTHGEWVERFWDHRNPRAAFQTEIKPKQKVYAEGEHVTFLFQTDRDCYLWIFSIDKQGDVNMLLPNGYQRDPQLQHVPAGKEWVTIPDPKKFTLTVTPPYGTDRVKTVCTTRNVDVVAAKHVQALTEQSPMLSFPRDTDQFRLVDGAGVTLDHGEWSDGRTTVRTIHKGHVTRGMLGLQELGLVPKNE